MASTMLRMGTLAKLSSPGNAALYESCPLQINSSTIGLHFITNRYRHASIVGYVGLHCNILVPFWF